MILSSTALIVVSFIIALYNGKLGQGEVYITIGQNCLPVVMLALSIIVSGAKYGIRSEKIHDCAQSLNNLKKILRYDIEDNNFIPSAENFNNYTKQYSEIISKYENHKKIDSIIEALRNTTPEFFSKIQLEILAEIIGRGILYYFYLLISFMSIGWMILGIYLPIKEVLSC